MKHADVQRNLYEYLSGELTGADRSKVEEHLASCPRCAAASAELGRSMERLARAMGDPAAERPDAYWDGFADGVERKIRSAVRTTRDARPTLWEQVRSFVVVHRGAALAAGVGCVLIVAGLLYRAQLSGPRPDGAYQGLATAERPAPDSLTVIPASVRLERYLRRSKNLLVGITNMKADADHPIDLSAERDVSRSLIKEARYLQSQDIDRRSARLISSLTKILIELANLEAENDVPGVEIIRGGIHQENLLFKIRMAEVINDSSADNTHHSF